MRHHHAPHHVSAEVVVPVRWGRVDPTAEADFEAHLALLRQFCDVTVVDGSEGTHADLRRARWARLVRVMRPDPRFGGANGKVAGAMTGIEAARHERVVLADDDVRYDRAGLTSLVQALHDADLVLPQNYPTRFPWWAWWESGRVLLNRAVAADWPGTCAVRRSAVLAAGGWSSDVLYENLEMARTIRAAGGRVVHRPDLLVPRHPPDLRHFLRQRVRQAYEDQAQPLRLGLAAAVVPAALGLARRPRLLATAAASLVAVAEVGRRRSGASRVFPAHTPLAAPVWVLERGVCTWLAFVARARGGVAYHGRRMPVAAHSPRWLERHVPYRSERRPAAVRTRRSRVESRGMGGMAMGRARHHIHITSGGDMASTARDVMTAGAECVGEKDTVATAAERMATLDVGSLPICGEDDRLKGMITDRDIVLKVVARGQDPQTTLVGSLAEGGEVVTIGADDSLDEARATMERHQVRRLPVIDGHRLVGIVSQADLARSLPDEDTGKLVESISQE
jgi:CBS domain-containing protein